MNQLTNRQVAVILSLSIVSLKFLIFPSLVGTYSLNDCYLSVIISLLQDLVFILLILWVMKRNPDKSIFQLIEDKMGKIFSKFIATFLMLFFIAKAIVSVKETQNFFVQLLFEHISWWTFAVPFISLVLYMLNKSFRTFARSTQFFYYIIIVGAIITLVLPINQLELARLLPFLSRGVFPVIKGSFFTSFQFMDYAVLLIMMGRVKYTPKTGKTIITYTLITDLIIIIFFITFVGLFNNIVINQGIAVSDMPLYSDYPSNNGRLEWLSMIVWTIALVYQSVMLLICARESMSYLFGLQNNALLSVIITIVVSISLYLLYLNFAVTITLVTSFVFNVVIQTFHLIFLVVLLILGLGGRKNAIKTQKVG